MSGGSRRLLLPRRWLPVAALKAIDMPFGRHLKRAECRENQPSATIETATNLPKSRQPAKKLAVRYSPPMPADRD